MITNATVSLRSAAVLLAASLAAACSGQPAPPGGQAAPAAGKEAQPPAKKPHQFRGKVEKIDPATKSLTVAGEDVEGWMAAMTMVYVVANADVLSRVAVGDQITATVYDGDFATLHDVAVAPPKPSK